MDSKETTLINVSDLIFDPNNPRLPDSLDKVDESQVVNWMLREANIIELMASIGEKGFFPAEPLLVIPSKANKYIVVEGNRRLTALKLLSKPTLADVKKISVNEATNEASQIPEKIPCLVYDHRSQIEEYLGYRHITGVKPWSALAKAKYLRQLKESVSVKDLRPSDQYRSLARTIGSRSSHVKLLLTGLEVYDQIVENSFFKISNLNEEKIDFGVLYTALTKSEISNYVGIDLSLEKPYEKVDIEHLGELTHWMFEKNNQNKTRIGESRNLGDLDKVISNETSLKMFREGSSLEDSLLFVEDPSEVFTNSITESLENIKISNRYITHINHPNRKDEEQLIEIRTIVRDLITLVGKRLNPEDE